KVYFAPVAVAVGEVNVSVGDVVKKGDVLLTYDKAALEEARQEAAYKLASSEGGLASSLHKDEEYIADLSEANRNLPVLDQQIADNEALLAELNKKIEEKQAGFNYNGTNLNVSILEWQQIVAQDEQALAAFKERVANGELNDYSDEEIKRMNNEAEIKLANDRETLLNLQIQTQYNGYEESNNKEIRDLQRQAKEVEELIASYKEYQSEMKSQKAASESGVLDEGGRKKLEADAAYESLTNQEALEAISAAQAGIRADFDGVVTELEAVAGAVPAENGKLLTVESIERVMVRLKASKYDLEKLSPGQEAEVLLGNKTYRGSVTKIDGMAQENMNGASSVGVDVAIADPDGSVVLGVEAKVNVHMAEVKDAVTIPMEVVNSDTEGDFVFVEQDGAVAKRRITVGISDETVCEVKEGLAVGDRVIYSVGLNLEEGMAINVSDK
ncbi:MAG: efflux RND transporter periplasmic adaptor subunit, partial [Bacteroidales bacterium]|nr:efflux RND transporter periplasmic adaptor subunit [Bacteroidales bacterium]